MHWRFCARSVAIGGLCLTATLATGAVIAPACAQAMQQTTGFNWYDPQWASTSPSAFTGLSMAPGASQQVYTTKFGAGTVNLFAASNNGDNGARAIGTSGNFFDPLPFSPAMQQQDWFTSLANPAWKSSLVGTYKSEPNAALNGLYTTAGFGVTNFRTGAPGLPGLTNFSSGNDAVGVSASAGVGFQVTPQISIEGSVSFTQMPPSTLR